MKYSFKKNSFPEYDLISSITRFDAIETGLLIDVSGMAKEAGFKYSVCISSGLKEKLIEPDDILKKIGQSYDGRLWDTLHMLSLAVNKAKGPANYICYSVYFQMIDDKDKPSLKEFELQTIIHEGDNLEPVITIMLPDNF